MPLAWEQEVSSGYLALGFQHEDFSTSKGYFND